MTRPHRGQGRARGGRPPPPNGSSWRLKTAPHRRRSFRRGAPPEPGRQESRRVLVTPTPMLLERHRVSRFLPIRASQWWPPSGRQQPIAKPARIRSWRRQPVHLGRVHGGTLTPRRRSASHSCGPRRRSRPPCPSRRPAAAFVTRSRSPLELFQDAKSNGTIEMNSECPLEPVELLGRCPGERGARLGDVLSDLRAASLNQSLQCALGALQLDVVDHRRVRRLEIGERRLRGLVVVEHDEALRVKAFESEIISAADMRSQ